LSDRPPMQWPKTGNCPTCGTLCFVGENTGPCAACVHAGPPKHETQRLFEPAPAQLPGQLGLGDG
jgi:hypothetical protein